MLTLQIVMTLALSVQAVVVKVNNGNCVVEWQPKSLFLPMNFIESCRVIDYDWERCEECEEGFKLSEDKRSCSGIPTRFNKINLTEFQEISEQNPNCLTYTSCSRCIECPTGTMLSMDQKRCEPIKQACLREEMGVCFECLEKINGICTFPDRNCIQRNIAGKCQQCRQGFSPNQHVCVRDGRMVFYYTQINCAVWRAGGCVQCKQSYKLNEGRCFNAISKESLNINTN